ncbi:hypothetical protein [Nostoc sp. 'Lobaria pulmonaria (5183) cyanobiont']|nr:hypothetical protein [Nostoc sp. 'Lobaria pulmonaria (5183) cyanobiont']
MKNVLNQTDANSKKADADKAQTDANNKKADADKAQKIADKAQKTFYLIQ